MDIKYWRHAIVALESLLLVDLYYSLVVIIFTHLLIAATMTATTLATSRTTHHHEDGHWHANDDKPGSPGHPPLAFLPDKRYLEISTINLQKRTNHLVMDFKFWDFSNRKWPARGPHGEWTLQVVIRRKCRHFASFLPHRLSVQFLI